MVNVMQLIRPKLHIFLILAILLIIADCKRDEDIVPYKYVDFYIYMSDPQFTELNTYYNPVMVTGVGVTGIIIYRKSEEEFSALEQTCTYKPSERCRVIPDSTGLKLKCQCCESIFTTTTDGFPEEGSVAEKPLVQYRTDYDGTKIHVYN